MIASKQIIGALQFKYREYLEKVNLTQEAKAKTHELINELALVKLIYFTTSPQNQQLIIQKLKQVQKVLEGRLKGQGWMTYFSRSNEVITLEQVWKVIKDFQNDPRQNLIKEIWAIKQAVLQKREMTGQS